MRLKPAKHLKKSLTFWCFSQGDWGSQVVEGV